MKHIVLLGDSVFDNKSYVKSGLDVIAHIRRQIPAEWKASLRAVDGSVVENVRNQILNLPDDATHLVISVGGNDAILNADEIEPSEMGGGKIANAVVRTVNEHNFESHRTEVFI